MDKSSESKVKFRQASNDAKGFLKLPNLHILIKKRVHHFPETFLNKCKSATPGLFNGPKGWSSASDKTKLFAENLTFGI